MALERESNSSMSVLWSLMRMALRRDLTLVSKVSKARVLADFTTRTDSSESVELVNGGMGEIYFVRGCVWLIEIQGKRIRANH